MLDEDMLKEALECAMRSEYYKEEYESAPSERCKRYLALGHFYSHYWVTVRNDKDLDEELHEERAKIEQELQLEDWEHLLKYAPHNPIRLKYKKKIEELKAKQQAEGQPTGEE